jgi:hypothetical protein
MCARRWFAVVCMAVMTAAAIPQTQDSKDQPVDPVHRAGPHGLEGWTLKWMRPDHHNAERFPVTLVIARSGTVVRKIKGEPFVWKWIFWEDGSKVAYEAGRFHLSLQCNLMDIETGLKLDSIDCFHELPQGAPAWAKALEASK